MYYDFFGFKEPPFSIAPDPRYLYLSERHKEALAHLMYGVQGQGGFIVITGEVGTGKTTVSRCFIENAPAYVDIALILNPRLSARELLSAVCDELEIRHPESASIKQLVDLINEDLLKAHAAGRHKVLMIDEAQNLSADVLEQLRLLTNLETAEKKLLQIVLLGQPELQQMLALPKLRQLNQRVTARYHLDAIGRNELPAYLNYRLGVAGMRGDLFSVSAIRVLYSQSNGIPRLINLISDRALLGAYAEGEHDITPKHIRQATKEVAGNHSGAAASGSGDKFSGFPLLAASLVLAVISSIWVYQSWQSSEPASVVNEALAEPGDMIERISEPDSQQLDRPPQETSAGSETQTPALKTDPYEFPEQALDASAAFRALFDVWELEGQPDVQNATCDFARESGVGCLERQGSRRSLTILDRPAILLLQDDAGNRGYAVLRHLDDDVAEVLLPEGSRRISFASLEPFWLGEYRVLWQRPDYLANKSGSGGGAGKELWIGARMMELAESYSESAEDNARVNRMSTEEQVRWYQSLRGLKVDGIAGAMTIIQINNDLKAEVPRLESDVPEGRG